jgi:hypothetical protein
MGISKFHSGRGVFHPILRDWPPGWVLNHPKGMVKHPFWVLNHPKSMVKHPFWMLTHPKRMVKHRFWMLSHPFWRVGIAFCIENDLSSAPPHPFRVAQAVTAGNCISHSTIRRHQSQYCRPCVNADKTLPARIQPQG